MMIRVLPLRPFAYPISERRSDMTPKTENLRGSIWSATRKVEHRLIRVEQGRDEAGTGVEP